MRDTVFLFLVLTFAVSRTPVHVGGNSKTVEYWLPENTAEIPSSESKASFIGYRCVVITVSTVLRTVLLRVSVVYV